VQNEAGAATKKYKELLRRYEKLENGPDEDWDELVFVLYINSVYP
jgi:hypothetical protein